MTVCTGRIQDLGKLQSDSANDYLAALARGAEILSHGKGWPGGVIDLFGELGRATHTNRIWLFRVLELSDTHMVMNFPFEWVDDPKHALKINPRYDTKRWDFKTCSSIYRTLVASRRRREWQTIIIDELEDCDFKEYQRAQGVQSTITIPVMIQNEWWGLFGFDDCTNPRVWSEQEKSLLRMASDLLAAGIVRDRMTSTQRQFEILSNITESSAWELDAGSGYFWCNQKILSDQDKVSENIRLTPLQLVRKIHPDDRKLVLSYLQVQLKSGDSNFRHDLRLRREGHYVWIDVIAKITFDCNQRLKKLSGIIVDIPERKKQEESLLRQATQDALTGIANRGAFNRQFKQMLQSHQAGDGRFCLLLLDIDHFKLVNDTWGHSMGDLALKHIVQILQQTLREADFLARIGGEEFAMLLQHTSLEDGKEIAERIRQNTEQTPLNTPEEIIPLTVSIGVVCSDCFGAKIDGDSTFRLADEALYRAKNNGRNRVVLA